MEFLRRLGGENTVSAGVRRAIRELVQASDEARRLMQEVADEGYAVGDVLR